MLLIKLWSPRWSDQRGFFFFRFLMLDSGCWMLLFILRVDFTSRVSLSGRECWLATKARRKTRGQDTRFNMQDVRCSSWERALPKEFFLSRYWVIHRKDGKAQRGAGKVSNTHLVTGNNHLQPASCNLYPATCNLQSRCFASLQSGSSTCNLRPVTL